MSKANLLDRRSVVSSLLKDRKGMVAVGGLGASTNDMAAAGDHDRNFYLWGAMGGAVMMGLGLALAQPDTAGGRHHRRRRDADGHRLACHRRLAEARQPLDRRARQ